MNKLEHFDIVPDNVDNLLILMHGYGSSGDDLIPVGLSIKQLLPNTAIIFANAPIPCENGSGFQWFSMRTMNLFTILKEIKRSHILISHLVKEQLERFNLSTNNLILGGFSQGAMMTMFNGLRSTDKYMALLCFSGMMPDTFETISKEIGSKPDVCLIHGNMDNVVPYDSMSKAEEMLRELDVPFKSYTIDGMMHEINYEALDKVKEFIIDICNKQ
jgi:phospholipase/carboxylesterase